MGASLEAKPTHSVWIKTLMQNHDPKQKALHSAGTCTCTGKSTCTSTVYHHKPSCKTMASPNFGS